MKKRCTNSCYFTMVAKGEDGKSVKVSPLKLESEFENKLYDATLMRKEMRKEITVRNKNILFSVFSFCEIANDVLCFIGKKN